MRSGNRTCPLHPLPTCSFIEAVIALALHAWIASTTLPITSVDERGVSE